MLALNRGDGALGRAKRARNQEPPPGLAAAAGALGAWRNASGARISTPSARCRFEQRELKHKIEFLPGCPKSANAAMNVLGHTRESRGTADKKMILNERRSPARRME
jgi:hypothetical protein